MEAWVEKGYYPAPQKFIAVDASAFPTLQSPWELPRDSTGRKLWPAVVTLDMLTAEERELYESTGVVPWDLPARAGSHRATPPVPHPAPPDLLSGAGPFTFY